jgi:iron complex transport system permease protein
MKKVSVFTLLVLCLTTVLVISLLLGRYPLSAADLLMFLGDRLFGATATDAQRLALISNIFIDIRLPRIFAALLVGAALSAAGTVFQSLFVNPLVSPGILGVLAGASCGAALGMLLGHSWLVVQVCAFVCGLLAVLCALGISGLCPRNRLLMLVLGGIISGAMFSALLSIIKYLADSYTQLPAIVYWLMGGFSATDRATVLVVAIPIVLALVLLLLLSGYLNVMSLGDEEARALGVNVAVLRLTFILLATIISALTVVLGGIIGWVGLLIPHFARMLVGPDNRFLLPAAVLLGATYVVAADDMARLLFPVEIPIGILTSLIGIPFFAIVLIKTRKGWI